MKDEGEVIIAWIIEMLILDKSADIGGGEGWLIFLLANAVFVMYCIYQYRREQDLKRERRKVREAEYHIKRAYESRGEKIDCN